MITLCLDSGVTGFTPNFETVSGLRSKAEEKQKIITVKGKPVDRTLPKIEREIELRWSQEKVLERISNISRMGFGDSCMVKLVLRSSC